MEKIKILDILYEINSIKRIASNLMEINFSNDIPSEFGDIELYTSGGYKCSTFSGFDTVYKQIDNVVILSNDGSIWNEPIPTPEPEPYVPTLEDVIKSKINEVNNECSKQITSGVDVTLTDGTVEHFDLKNEDQLAFLLCSNEVDKGKENIAWHPNGDHTLPCVFYSNADMGIIVDTVFNHIFYHQTYCNSLKIWIESCTSIDDVKAITYGADVPVEYQSIVLASIDATK